MIGNSRVFGQNRDPALALQVAGVHHTLRYRLVFAEYTALMQQAVDKRRLAMVNVGNDCNIPDIFSSHTRSFCVEFGTPYPRRIISYF
jgi:hypothetical protein